MWHVYEDMLYASSHLTIRAAAHQLRQDKYQDMRQKTQPCFIRDSDSSPHTEVARVCVLSYCDVLLGNRQINTTQQ
jgi:hypothetical protein